MAESVIYIVREGPQGIPGADGPSVQTNLAVIIGQEVQSLPLHDGTALTEVVINYGTRAGDGVTLTDGVLEFTVGFSEVSMQSEVHFVKITGKPEMTFWGEVSYDNCVTWEIAAGTLRKFVVEKDGSGLIMFDFSFDSGVQAGTCIRLVATNGAAAGSAEISPPSDTTTSKGVVTGFATKLVVSGRGLPAGL